jgi:hypothetical protein
MPYEFKLMIHLVFWLAIFGLALASYFGTAVRRPLAQRARSTRRPQPRRLQPYQD